MKAHKINFQINNEGALELFFRDRKIDLESFNGTSCSNLIGRLSRDVCVNGFAIRDSLEKVESGYYQSLTACPEFIAVLDKALRLKYFLRYDYLKNSKPYCVEYNVPIDKVIIDGYDLQDPEVKTDILLKSYLQHLYDLWCGDEMCASDGIVLRLQDNEEMASDDFIQAEEL